MIASNFAGESYYTQTSLPTPTTQISNIDVHLRTFKEAKPTRIYLDIEAGADVVHLSGSFYKHINNQFPKVTWNVYSSAATKKIRVNLPKFPADLIGEVTALAEIKDQDFYMLTISNYHMSYEDFYKFKLNDNFFNLVPFNQSRVYMIDRLSFGRQSGNLDYLMEHLGVSRKSGK